MDKKIIFGFFMLVLLFCVYSTSVLATDSQDALNTLYNYYDYEQKEDIDNFMKLVDASFLENSEQKTYLSEIKEINLALYDVYDTISFEITDVDLIANKEDAKIFYHLNSVIEDTESNSAEIDNAYVAILHNVKGQWKVTYTMARVDYEKRKLILNILESEIEYSENDFSEVNLTDIDNQNNDIDKGDSKKGFFAKLLNFFVSIFTSEPNENQKIDTPKDDIKTNDDKDDDDDVSDKTPVPKNNDFNIKSASCTEIEEEWIRLSYELIDTVLKFENANSYYDKFETIRTAKNSCWKEYDKRFSLMNECSDSNNAALSVYKNFARPNVNKQSYLMRNIIRLKVCLETEKEPFDSWGQSRSQLPFGCYGVFERYIQDKATEEEADNCYYNSIKPDSCENEYADLMEKYFHYQEIKGGGNSYQASYDFGVARSTFEVCRAKHDVSNEGLNYACEDAYYKYMLTIRSLEKAERDDKPQEYMQSQKHNKQMAWDNYMSCVKKNN